MGESFNDYNEKHRFWTEMSLGQLSLTNNLLLSISTGFLAFCFDKQTITIFLLKDEINFHWSIFYYFTALILVAITITLGIAVLLSRLYDFRISRHLTFIRKQFYEMYSDIIDTKHQDNKINILDRLKAFAYILFCKFPFIKQEYISSFPTDNNLIETVKKLKNLSKGLGSITWLWTKLQVLYFLGAIICYILHFLV